MALSKFLSVVPMTDKSSAKARTVNPAASSLSIRSLNMAKNKVGLELEPYIHPTPILMFLLLTLILDCSYNHSIVLTSSSYMFIFLSFFISILWLTLSKADLRSMYRDHTVFFVFLSFSSLISSIILKILRFVPKEALNPIYCTFILELGPSFSSFHSL